jgi:hypothetical protein
MEPAVTGRSPGVPPYFGGVRPTAIVGDGNTAADEYQQELKLEQVFFDSSGREVVPDSDGGFVVVGEIDHTAYILAIARANVAYHAVDSEENRAIVAATTLAELVDALRLTDVLADPAGRWKKIC